MPSLKRILNATARDEHGEKRGAITNVTLNLASGKCAIRIGGYDYSAEKATYEKRTLRLVCPQIATDKYQTLFGKTAYDAQGNYVGIIADVAFGTNLALNRITCDNGATFTRRRLQGAEDVVIIKLPKPKAAKAARKQQKQEKQRQATQQPSPAKSAAVTTTAFPARRRYGDFSFLIGKTADKNITNFYNEVMIRRGSKITAETLKQAKTSGKLIELCLHAR